MVDQKSLYNYLLAAGTLFLIVCTLSVVSFASSYAKSSDRNNFRVFTVSAEGKAVGTPDVAEFTFTVFTEGDENVSEIEAENTTKNKLVLDFLKAKNISERDIKTEQYSVEPRYNYVACRDNCVNPEIEGYTVRQTTLVTIRDFGDIGEILTGVASANVNNISQLNFKVDDKVKLENEARDEAIKLAKEKAKATAKSGGFKLGKLTSVNESFYPIYSERMLSVQKEASFDSVMSDMAEPALVAEPVVAEINPGTQEITVNVTLSYTIE